MSYQWTGWELAGMFLEDKKKTILYCLINCLILLLLYRMLTRRRGVEYTILTSIYYAFLLVLLHMYSVYTFATHIFFAYSSTMGHGPHICGVITAARSSWWLVVGKSKWQTCCGVIMSYLYLNFSTYLMSPLHLRKPFLAQLIAYLLTWPFSLGNTTSSFIKYI